MTDAAPETPPADTVPKSALDAAEAARAAAEKALAEAVKDAVDALPEKARALVPDLPDGAKLEWLRKARASGVFAPQTVPPTDGGGRPAAAAKAPELSTLPPVARIAAGYRKA